MERVGVPVTIGVARTKTLAKLVSDLAKPFGTLAHRETGGGRAAGQPARVGHYGIAARSAAKLVPHGIHTCLDFARARPSVIRKVLTVTGERLCYELNGERCIPLLTTRPPHKNFARGGSIGQVSSDPELIWGWVIRNLERLAEELEYHGVMAGKLLVIFDYKNGPTVTEVVSTGPPTRRFSLLLEAVRHAWKRVYVPGLLLYRMHLIADHLQYRGLEQLGLFDPPLEQDRATTRLKLDVNARHGRFALRSAATLPLREIYLDEAHGFEVCDIHGKTCF